MSSEVLVVLLQQDLLLPPLHESEELVMMKSRMVEITTLVIKDNGPPGDGC